LIFFGEGLLTMGGHCFYLWFTHRRAAIAAVQQAVAATGTARVDNLPQRVEYPLPQYLRGFTLLFVYSFLQISTVTLRYLQCIDVRAYSLLSAL
jgi:hypothetical protein